MLNLSLGSLMSHSEFNLVAKLALTHMLEEEGMGLDCSPVIDNDEGLLGIILRDQPTVYNLSGHQC